jgi:hypothetical protein
MSFTQEQLSLIQNANAKIEFELNGLEILAIYSLGQMNNKIVKFKDNIWCKSRVGLFTIDHINGNTELDFTKPKPWLNVTIDSIAFSIKSPNEWGGENCSAYESLLDIKSIALLTQITK